MPIRSALWRPYAASVTQRVCPQGHVDGVKRSRVIEHLVEMADEASAMLRLRDTEIGWPLEELWATGELLTASTIATTSIQRITCGGRRVRSPT